MCRGSWCAVWFGCFCSITANASELILKYTIVHFCWSTWKNSCQNLYFWCFTSIYFFGSGCSLWEILFSWKPKNAHPNINSVELWPFEPMSFSIFSSFWSHHPKTLSHIWCHCKALQLQRLNIVASWSSFRLRIKAPFYTLLVHSLRVGSGRRTSVSSFQFVLFTVCRTSIVKTLPGY